MTRVIRLTAINKSVSLSAYVQAIRAAKRNPDRLFKTGLTSWWPTTGADIVGQYRAGIHQRINEAIPWIERGRAKT